MIPVFLRLILIQGGGLTGFDGRLALGFTREADIGRVEVVIWYGE